MKNASNNKMALENVKACIRSAALNPMELQNKEVQDAVHQCLRDLENGFLRVATPKGMEPTCGQQPMRDLQNWEVHSWVKQSILLAMRLRTAKKLGWPIKPSDVSPEKDLDKISDSRPHSKALAYNDKFDVQSDMEGVRSIYGSVVREGAYVSPGTILMPSFVNIGAWVGAGTMVDTWATAGSCAQIGQNVHLAGGVGIGGVLEPESARPVLIGDNAFLGSRAIVVEGTVIGEEAVLGANVCLTKSTPIYDVTQTTPTVYRGFVPPRAVVAPGTRVKSFPGGDIQLQCAYIIAYRSEKTDSKVSLNDILRETGLSI